MHDFCSIVTVSHHGAVNLTFTTSVLKNTRRVVEDKNTRDLRVRHPGIQAIMALRQNAVGFKGSKSGKKTFADHFQTP